MLCFYFTTPASRRLKRHHPPPPATLPRGQVVLTWALLLLWALLMSFGVVYLLNPPWLQELSRPGKDVEALDSKHFGDNALRLGNYRIAIANYRRSLEIQPDQVKVLTNLAVAYRKAGDSARAAQILMDALERQPHASLRSVINDNLGELFEQQGNLGRALHYYQEELRCDVAPERACHRLAAVYIKTERFEEARAAFEEALTHLLSLDLEYQRMLKKAADICAEEPEHLKIIEEHLARGVSPEDLQYYDLDIIRSTQEHDRAIASVHDKLGLVCAKLGDIDAAIDHFERTLDIFPDNPAAKERLRQLRLRSP